jgi:hypothetical protein
MKKIFICVLILSAGVLQFCSSSKKAQAVPEPKLTYEANIQPIITGNCSPCHIPPRGNKKAYNTYLPVKTDIDSILSRIQRSPAEKGFMPFKHAKLPDSTIMAFVKWKSDGLLEK